MRATRFATATIVLALALATAAPGGAAGTSGGVLPPQARPLGYSLADMVRATALFTNSGNDPANYPDTPFQVLYGDPSTVAVGEADGCLLVTGTNGFTTDVRTFSFAPIFNSSDVPPVDGVFPTTPAEAEAYIFGPDQFGGQFEIVVDGTTTLVGPTFLVGPVAAPLESLGGSKIVTLGVFLRPFRPGTHTVVVGGTFTGTLAQEVFGAECVSFTFTYTVHVVPSL